MIEQSITDTTPDQPAAEPTLAPAFDLDTWISGMSATERSVEIYGNTSVFGEYEHLVRELDVARREEAAGERSVEDDGGRVARIEARIAELAEIQQQSKTTWYVTALDGEVFKAINEEHPVPDALPEPEKPSKNAHPSVKARYEAEHAEWVVANGAREAERTAAQNERNLHQIAASVVRVEDWQGNVLAGTAVGQPITVAQLKAMERKPHGPLQVGRLLTAVAEAKFGEPVIDAPFSSATSRSARG
ncbi:hypothetical protein [Xylanimonas oleitrophica]|uniref:hypothetical protein n=1 Tax=Xylanimonas oleitrophica TaxID=2607479 RepID=UPI0011B7A9B1|nr:hypothetical protein [Xylanimonas oleitrophica]